MGADSGSLAAVVRDGRPGPAIQVGDFKRAFARFQRDQVTDHAAALTYYALLSLFPGAAVRRGAAGLLRPAGPDLRRRELPHLDRRAERDDRRGHGRARGRAGEPRHRADRARARDGHLPLRGLGGVRRRRAGAERDLAGRRGALLRQAQGPRHRLDGRGARARARDGRPRVPRRGAVGVRLQPDRARRHDRRGLALRPLARGAPGDDPHLRRRLLRGAQRGDPPLPVDHPGRDVRGARDAARLGWRSSSTSRTSAPTRPPTARSPAW